MLNRTMFCAALALVLAGCYGAADPESGGPGAQDEPVAATRQALSAPTAGCSTVTTQSLVDLKAKLQLVTDLMQPDYTLCMGQSDTTECFYLSYGLQNVATASGAVQDSINMFASQGYTTATVNGGSYVNDELAKNAVPAIVRNELYILRSRQWCHSPNAPTALERNMEALEAANDLLARAGRCAMGTP
jgi:hypothetical protein